MESFLRLIKYIISIAFLSTALILGVKWMTGEDIFTNNFLANAPVSPKSSTNPFSTGTSENTSIPVVPKLSSSQNNSGLPFEQTCSSLQAYFNSIPWNTPTEFKGFESSEYIEYISRKTGSPTDIVNTPSWALCSNGYIIESSPMGTRVCKGNIEYQYHINSSKPSQRYWKANSSSDCRWK